MREPGEERKGEERRDREKRGKERRWGRGEERKADAEKS